jgi:hypothetical protein
VLAGDAPVELDVPGLRPWDVINAGWLARVRLDPDAYALRVLAERTEQACREVLG